MHTLSYAAILGFFYSYRRILRWTQWSDAVIRCRIPPALIWHCVNTPEGRGKIKFSICWWLLLLAKTGSKV